MQREKQHTEKLLPFAELFTQAILDENFCPRVCAIYSLHVINECGEIRERTGSYLGSGLIFVDHSGLSEVKLLLLLVYVHGIQGLVVGGTGGHTAAGALKVRLAGGVGEAFSLKNCVAELEMKWVSRNSQLAVARIISIASMYKSINK